MHTNFKLWLVIGITLPTLTGCGPFGLGNPTPATPTVTKTATPPPGVTDTATLLPATEAPAPPITGLHMLDVNFGWAWTNTGQMLRTADGGQTWMDRTPGEAVGPEGSSFFDNQTAWQPILLKASSRFGLLHTSDGGQTWAQISFGPQNSVGPASVLHFTDALNGWAETGDVAAGNIYYSLSETQDGGKTWAPIPVKPLTAEVGLPPGTVHLCGLCEDSFYYDPERILIVHGDEASMESTGVVRIQVSFDLGNTWLTRALPLPKDTPDAAVGSAYPTFFSGGNGLLPVQLIKTDNNGNTVYQHLAIYATKDGGANWILLPGILDEVGMFPQLQMTSPKDIFALCGNALCSSHDGAQTWQMVASSLDFSRTDFGLGVVFDFINASAGWFIINQENGTTSLYKTMDGGNTWTKLAPLLAASAPVAVKLDTSLPTPTRIPNPTFVTPTPNVAFDQNANANRIRFAPNGTWIEINDTISANTSKRYVLSAMQGQIMSVSIPQGPTFSINVAGADKKSLNDLHNPRSFWRGVLPSAQDYIVSVNSQAGGPFTLCIAINPPGQATQNFGFVDPHSMVALSYTDEFAPTSVQVPVNTKSTPLLTLAFIDSSFYSPATNLSESYLVLAASADPTTVSTCTQPSTQVPETITGHVSVNNYTFTRSEFNGAAAGNLYDQISYRTEVDNKCFEVIFLIHSTNIANYPAGTVVAFNRDALLGVFETVLNTFGAK